MRVGSDFQVKVPSFDPGKHNNLIIFYLLSDQHCAWVDNGVVAGRWSTHDGPPTPSRIEICCVENKDEVSNSKVFDSLTNYVV